MLRLVIAYESCGRSSFAKTAAKLGVYDFSMAIVLFFGEIFFYNLRVEPSHNHIIGQADDLNVAKIEVFNSLPVTDVGYNE